MSRRPVLVTVGDNCLDVYLSYDRLAVGGNALNVAAQWRRNGWSARYFGAVGNDPEADVVVEELAAVGVSPADVERQVGETGVTLLSHDSGDRNILLELLGVGEHYAPSDEAYAQIAAADWVHLGTNANPALVRRLVAEEVPFSIDISTNHTAVPLRGVPLVFASGSDEVGEHVEPLFASLFAAGARRVVVTRGALGAFYSDGQGVLHAPAAPAELVDTCGAGDSFIATFITALHCESRDPAESLRRATLAAAETCGHLGGFPQRPRPIPAWLRIKYATPILNAQGH
jgi:fructoselysine 6-kinase